MPQATTRLPSQSPRVGEPFAFRRRWPSSSVSRCFWEEPKKGILGRIPSSLFPSVSLRNVYIWKAKPFPSFSRCTIPLVQSQPLILSSLTRLARPMVSLILHTPKFLQTHLRSSSDRSAAPGRKASSIDIVFVLFVEFLELFKKLIF